ncbi:MAG: HAMP domain-containing histidine kinase, partial [Oscillospiraceae bacterium]|nr:HAMP domain-containing histidine kinase [Oscillospiraceae bacterium]
YSDSGDTVTVTANLLPSSFTVSVADTGIGISPEDLPKVKTKFYKANSTRRGSGIGLAVADEIVRMHGGSLDIASKLGEGTTVTITLPLLQEEKSS